MNKLIWTSSILCLVASLGMPDSASAATCTVPNAIANGQVADASKVMDNFNAVANCVQQSVTTTGTPIAGALPVFSGPQTLAAGNLVGDVTTSGGTTTTLSNTGVVPGIYSNPNIAIDAKGRITSASSGAGGTGGGLVLISDITLTSAGTIDFTSIPTTFSDLILVVDTRWDTGPNVLEFYAQFNGDTAPDYNWYVENRYGSTTASNVSQARIGASIGPAASSGVFAINQITIYDADSAMRYKNISYRGIYNQNPSSVFIDNGGGFWANNSPITGIHLFSTATGTLFAPGTHARLYGRS